MIDFQLFVVLTPRIDQVVPLELVITWFCVLPVFATAAKRPSCADQVTADQVLVTGDVCVVQLVPLELVMIKLPRLPVEATAQNKRKLDDQVTLTQVLVAETVPRDQMIPFELVMT